MAQKNISCFVETTLAVIGGRWKVLILQQLFGSVKRFNELHRLLAGITHKTLTQQLREIPPKVEYSLTSLGKTLRPVLMAMHDWAERHGRALEHGKRAHSE
jgi:DNA-binding HxlR family transcriptional regulator